MRHLYEALSPMFIVSLLVGTSSIYRQENNGKHHLRSSNVFKMLTVLYLSIYTFTMVTGISNMDVKSTVTYFGNAMSSIGLVLDVIGQILLIYIIYFFSFVVTRNVKKVFNKIAIIDSVLQELGHKPNYNKTFWQQIVLLFIGIFSILFAILSQLYVVSNQSTFRLNVSMWFIYYFPIVITFVMECQFSFTVFLVYQRFKIINTMINDMTTKSSRSQLLADPSQVTDVQVIKSKECAEFSSVRRIATLMEIHDSIVDTAEDLNANFSFQILICLTVLFIKTVFAAFFSYFELMINGKTEISINWIVWLAINWHEILLITVTCHLASAQSQQTGVEVHKLIMNSEGNSIRDKLIVFSQQVFHRPVNFTACGLFSINAELVFTILGAAITYLLIMLQFQDGNEASCISTNSTV